MKSFGVFFIVKLLAFFVGVFTCFTLHHSFSVPVVVSAALTGLLGSFLPHSSRFQDHPHAAVYTGAFAGMCSGEVIQSNAELALVCIVGAFIYSLARNYFVGIGGKLGAIAFVSVVSVLLVKGLIG